MDVALELSKAAALANTPGLFQSLFSWMSLLNQKAGGAGGGAVGVSILVLVDVALEPAGRILSAGCTWKVSILVLVDVALELP